MFSNFFGNVCASLIVIRDLDIVLGSFDIFAGRFDIVLAVFTSYSSVLTSMDIHVLGCFYFLLKSFYISSFAC